MKRDSIPKHFAWEKKKQVIFHIPGRLPITNRILVWKKSFQPDYKGIVIRYEETFYRLRAGEAL